MADKKISALTAASTPLGGAEVFPIVQSATTVKATIADVQAAPVAAGTAAGVQFLNGSKVPVTSTALQFDGQNLGVGQYPSNAANITTNIELPYGATIASRSNTAAPQLYIMSNALGTGYAPTYAINGYATQYQMQGFDGNHYWATAPTGVAGAAISFTTRMELANSTGNLTLNTGNLVIGTSGKGIDFSATSGSGTSELFADYEEGNWTPSVTSSSGSITTLGTLTGKYTKTGNVVTLFARITITTNGTGSGSVVVAGLPYSANTSISAYSGYGRDRAISGKQLQVDFVSTGSSFEVYNYDNTYPGASGATLIITVIYNAA